MTPPTQPRPSFTPNLALEQVKSLQSLHEKVPTHTERDMKVEGLDKTRATAQRWSRRKKLGLAAAIAALTVVIIVLVAFAFDAPPSGVPSSLPIPAGTVFPLPPLYAPNGTLMGYFHQFNSSGSVPAGQCLELVGAWSATALTVAPGAWPPNATGGGLNGTIDGPIVSEAPAAGGVGFYARHPDTITVTATIQWIVVSCPP